MSVLYSKTVLGLLTLQNHLVMSPMTRNRATTIFPMRSCGVLRATRHGGLIVTKARRRHRTGWLSRIPGIFSTAQVEGWKALPMRCMPGREDVRAVHALRAHRPPAEPAAGHACWRLRPWRPPGDVHGCRGPEAASRAQAMTEADSRARSRNLYRPRRMPDSRL